MLVLNEIADDYEEPDHVHERLAKRTRQFGLHIDLTEVNRALIDLVRLGWAKAYDLWKQPPEEFPAALDVENVGDYYYWITAPGLEAHSSFENWPFGEEGEIVPGWATPAE